MGALGRNFSCYNDEQKEQTIDALLELSSTKEKDKKNRVGAVKILDILYPHLEADKRKKIRNDLELIREDLKSPAMMEFFKVTVPEVEGEKEQ